MLWTVVYPRYGLMDKSEFKRNFHNLEPVVSHEEKSKFFIFLLEIAYGGEIFFLEIFFKLNPPKKSQFVTAQRLVKNKQNLVTHNLIINLALFNLHNSNTLLWAWKLTVEGLQVFWRQLYFFGLITFKVSKSHLHCKIANHFFNQQIHYPVKYQHT